MYIFVYTIPTAQPTSVPTSAPSSAPTSRPTAQPTSTTTTNAPTIAPTIVPTVEGSINFDLFLDLGSWPSASVDSTIESYLLSTFATATGVDASYLSLEFEFIPENRRRQLTVADKQRILTTSWTLKITCTVTASSSSYQQISSTYTATISATSTSSLVSGLNSACGFTAYSSISIDSYGVEIISKEDKSNENLALLSILVLIIVPIAVAFYYVKITYNPVKNSEETAYDAADVVVELEQNTNASVDDAAADVVLELEQNINASVDDASGDTCIVVNDDAL